MGHALSTGVESLLEASNVPGAILVVEDEVLVRAMVAEALREKGYTVVEAGNADEALTILQGGTKVHIVFTDISMPGSIDGMDLARIVCSKYPGIDVLVTSGELRSTKVEEGVKGFFSKPYDLRQLVAHIGSLFQLREAGSTSPAVKE